MNLLGMFQDAPFEQWGDVGGGDLVYLLPWVVLIFLLVPKGDKASSGSPKPAKPAKAASGGGPSFMTLAVIAGGIYLVLSNGLLDGVF